MLPLAASLQRTSRGPGWFLRWACLLPVVALFAAVMCPLLMPPGRWMVGAKRRKWKAMVE